MLVATTPETHTATTSMSPIGEGAAAFVSRRGGVGHIMGRGQKGEVREVDIVALLVDHNVILLH
jgi:hypothetical protein